MMMIHPTPLIPANAGTQITSASGPWSSADLFSGLAPSSFIWAPAFAGVSGINTEGLTA